MSVGFVHFRDIENKGISRKTFLKIDLQDVPLELIKTKTKGLKCSAWKSFELCIKFGSSTPLGIGLSLSIRGAGREGGFLSLRIAYILSLSLLLCLELCFGIIQRLNN